MPTTHIWAVSKQGRVYTLATCGQQWEELTYSGVEFKRVSVVDWCGWAIGGDHQLYVYVFATDVPICCKEVVYENQRWVPTEGFGTRLLPTDRPAWSSKDGRLPRLRESIVLPTTNWKWENDWQVEHNYDGQVIDPEGWMYAVDFPSTYRNEKTWLSYVRRRKWIRVRRYASTDCWGSVPCFHDDPITEPFIDVAIGGQRISGAATDSLAVWTVTILGRIFYRTGVSKICPDGTEWVHVETPQSCEVNQLSVGPTGLVWAVTWNGCALVRIGVGRRTLQGSHWVNVSPPSEDSKLFQVSVGTDAVWAVTRNSKVWFRTGIKGLQSETIEENAMGSSWVEMVGDMCLVSVGLNDQVLSLGTDAHSTIYIRTGILGQDLNGKEWKPIVLSNVISRKNSMGNDVIDVDESNSQNFTCDSGMQSLVQEMFGENYSSLATETWAASSVKNEHGIPVGLTFPMDETGEKELMKINDSEQSVVKIEQQLEEDILQRFNNARITTVLQGNSTSPVKRLQGLDDSFNEEFAWSWISGSGCAIDGLNMPNWFNPGTILGDFATQIILNKPWRKEIIERLLHRNNLVGLGGFSTYDAAIEKTSWTVTAKGQVFLEGRQSSWATCNLELEKTKIEGCSDMAMLRCFHHNGHGYSEQIVIDMHVITCTVCVSDHQKFVCAVYTPSAISNGNPLRIAFWTDSELEDWLALLSNTCCELRGISGTPSSNAIWSVSTQGDIFTYDAKNDFTKQSRDIFWRQLGGHMRLVETCPAGIVWGLGYDNTPWVYTGGWGGGFFKGMDSSGFGIHPMHDTRCMYIYENQRWNPLSGFSNKRLPTDRFVWSDESGRVENTKESIGLPSMHWQWSTDWMIDFSTPNGVDKNGWQYAKDFPMNYHGQKCLTDYVRRRRWYRKCKLSTCGPWEELDSIPLIDISIQTDYQCSPLFAISLWGVSIKGEVLCRIGVTQSCRKGLYWKHVPLNHAAQSLSIGGGGEVWVICTNGSIFLRHGVTEDTPMGFTWIAVESPPIPFQHISAGHNTVCAIDTAGQLYFRQEVMRVLPQGTYWKHVFGKFHCVSVGVNDEVWAIQHMSDSKTQFICRCKNVAMQSEVSGSEMLWDYGISGNWHYISVRGFLGNNEAVEAIA